MINSNFRFDHGIKITNETEQKIIDYLYIHTFYLCIH